MKLLLIFCLLSIASCSKKSESIDLAGKPIVLEEIKSADILFSNRSQAVGMNQAFLEFADENAVLLRPNSYPIIGKKEVKKAMSSDDSKFNLTWKPMDGDVSTSGDLGYTYGTYTFKTSDTTTYGTYLSIWKKDSLGDWKWALDTGNDGLSSN
ncbi:MAG: nuclear transport factor 2 family protein [Bacteroidetes bacterium]|nr:nuclear transport factor 2 family protein [Bacteroidota bacterium]MDA1121884.1 nuclear transport factor 2 family protein [Bacteroidota bacterium]